MGGVCPIMPILRRETRQWIKKIQGQVEQGLSYDDDRLTLGQFMVGWLGNKKQQVRRSTYDGYKWVANKYLLPDLGKIRLRDLSAGQVQEYYDHLVNFQRGTRTIRLLHIRSMGAWSRLCAWA